MLSKRTFRIFAIASVLSTVIIGGTATNAQAATRRYVRRVHRNAPVVRSIQNNGVKVANSKQEFYNHLKDALENFETNVSIKVTNYNNRDYNLDVVNTIVLEHPDINYGYSSIQGQITGYQGSMEKTLNLTISYRTDKNTMVMEKRAVKNKVREIICNVIRPQMTDFEKELALHDYIVKNADYDVANYRAGIVTAEDHNAYGILVQNKGVCESYAKAMYELLNAAGVECKFVTGNSTQGPHAWNMVKIDNEWYNLDTTWDDPISDRTGGNNSNTLIPVSHKYFNVPDYIFNRDHRRGQFEMSYPACNGTRYSFENMNVVEYTGDGKAFVKITNQQQLDNEILKALRNKSDSLCVNFKGLNVTVNQLFDEIQYVARNNRIYGFGMQGSMMDSYGRVNFNWR